ncbi:hypothetical protein N9H93_03605 [Rhizobiaceae bacterium]|nr:hypothetical protein [Rhizobiaceae bacterium]
MRGGRRAGAAEETGFPQVAAGPWPRFPGFDYTDPRPFATWKGQLMVTCMRGWLVGDPPSLELATLALDELRQRRLELSGVAQTEAAQAVLDAEMRFAASPYEPIPWLSQAGVAVRRAFPPAVLADQKKGRLGGSVYVVLRGGYTESSGLYGAYVGSTGKTPERRIAEHRAGGRTAARGLPRHGIEPLRSLFEALNPVPKARAGREEWETRLHEALAPVVPRVSGDVAF